MSSPGRLNFKNGPIQSSTLARASYAFTLQACVDRIFTSGSVTVPRCLLPECSDMSSPAYSRESMVKQVASYPATT